MSEEPASIVAGLESRATRHEGRWAGGAMIWRAWGDGPPLVLLHGASGSWTHWIRNIEPLAARFRVLVPDLPGFGDSDLAPGPHTAEMLADGLLATLEAAIAPAAPLDIAGFSFGSIVGGVVAARLGRHVRTLVLLGAGGLGRGPWTSTPLSPLRPGMSRADVERVHRENLRILMIANPERADDLAVYLQVENLRRARFKSGTIPGSDVLLKAFPAITARTVSILGERDAFWSPRIAEYRAVLESLRPGLDFRMIPDAGHWAIYEAAEQATTELLDVLGAGQERVR